MFGRSIRNTRKTRFGAQHIMGIFLATASLGVFFDKPEDDKAAGGGGGGGGAATPTPREEFDKLKGEIAGVLKTAKDAKRDLTADERKANETRFTRMNAIKQMADDEQKLAELESVKFTEQVVQARNSEITGGAAAAAAGAANRSTITVGEDRAVRAKYDKHVKACEHFIRTGEVTEATRQEFAITTGTGSGFMVPKDVVRPTFVRRIFNPIFPALAAYGLSPMMTAGTETVSVPIFDDSSIDGVQTSESATTETTGPGDPSAANGDAGVAGIQLGAKLYDSGIVWTSNTQLSAITYDLLAYLEPAFEKRIDHKQAVDWFTQMKTNGTIGFTTTSATAVSYDDVNSFYYSLPYMYRADAVFFGSDAFYQTLSDLKDTLGRPIYRTSMRDGEPSTLFGKPAFTTDQLGAVTANQKTAVIASAEALKVRLVENKRLVRYVNIPTHPDQVGLQQFLNADFGFLTQGVRILKQGAS